MPLCRSALEFSDSLVDGLVDELRRHAPNWLPYAIVATVLVFAWQLTEDSHLADRSSLLPVALFTAALLVCLYRSTADPCRRHRKPAIGILVGGVFCLYLMQRVWITGARSEGKWQEDSLQVIESWHPTATAPTMQATAAPSVPVTSTMASPSSAPALSIMGNDGHDKIQWASKAHSLRIVGTQERKQKDYNRVLAKPVESRQAEYEAIKAEIRADRLMWQDLEGKPRLRFLQESLLDNDSFESQPQKAGGGGFREKFLKRAKQKSDRM